MLYRLGGQLLGVGAGDIELAEQGEGLPAVGVLDERELVQVLAAEDALEAFGFGVEAALPAGAGQRGPQLGLGEFRGRSRGRGGGQHGAGFWTQQAVAFGGEGDPAG